MQKDPVHLLYREEGITKIFPRMKLLVFILLLSANLASAKNYSAETELQQVVVTGTVVDQQGLPVIGATVVVKGTTLGTLTDGAGKYTLSNVPQNATLAFTFIGMTPQEVPLRGQTKVDVVLQEATLTLEEVVVIGYGTQKKESVVGAIAQTTNAQLQQAGSVTNLTQALTGHLPGVITITSTGEPGGTVSGEDATQIYIRGQNTWNGGQPLIIVDGVERSMSNLDVSEVENISVLKDASATAVFGVKGANGVILITTKRGSLGKTKLSFAYNATAKMTSKLPTLMDSYNAQLIRNESIERETVLAEGSWGDYIPFEIVSRYKLPQAPSDVPIFPNVDWEKALFRDVGWSQRATLNVQGGTTFVNYFASLSYFHEGDMFQDYHNFKGYSPSFPFDRFNFRSNLDFKLTKTTVLKVNLSGFYSNKKSSNSWDSGIWRAVYCLPPDTHIPQFDDGVWGYNPLTASWGNPVESLYNSGVREQRSTELNSDYSLDQNLSFITKGLTARAFLVYDNSIDSQGGINDEAYALNQQERWLNSEAYTGPTQDPREYTTVRPTTGLKQYDWAYIPWGITQEAVANSSIMRRLLYQFQLNYGRKFGMHNVGALALFKREEYASGSMFKNYREDWVFRTTYDYDSRYLVEFNGAYNGSEQFGPGYRFDFFPSVAVGWSISNERFWQIDWINRLKVRYSTGMVGDDKVSGTRWLYNSQIAYGGTAVLNRQGKRTSPYTWYKESVVGNPEIHWEKALKKNIGLELGLFKDMFSVTYDYFTEDRTDILLAGSSRNIPPYFGAVPPSDNLGRVKSKGWELDMKFDKRTSNFHYWVNYAQGHVENRILEKDDPILYNAYEKQAGFAVNQIKTQQRAEMYTNWDMVYASVPTESTDGAKLPGYWNLLDYNADGVINSKDSAPYGYSLVPQNTYNFEFGADYKGFSAMIQFYGVNNVSYSGWLYLLEDGKDIVFDIAADYWSKDNMDTNMFLPRWKTAGENIGEYFIFDASYLRLKTAEIAYTFDSNKLKKAGMSSLRLFVNGNNLIFWSDLPDDREGQSTGGGAAGGAYPTVKRVNFGVELTF